MSLTSISLLFAGTVLFIIFAFLVISFFISRKNKTDAEIIESRLAFQPAAPVREKVAHTTTSGQSLNRYAVEPRRPLEYTHTPEMPQVFMQSSIIYQKPKRLEIINPSYQGNTFNKVYYKV